MDGYLYKVAQNAQIRADLKKRVRVLSTQTSHPPYRYDALKREGEIRLIKFLDFSSDKPIIELNHAHVDQVLHYRALSYTWGNDAYTVENYLGTSNLKDVVLIRRIDPHSQETELGSLPVTKNCAEALWRLYADNPHVPVWIDAICIDQENIPERNLQIGLMESIYRGAAKVQVYIGADDAETHSEEAMKYLERNFRSILQGHGNPFENFGYADVLPRRVVDAIGSLLHREWFDRVWVLQEVQSAKFAEIICGKYKIPWLALRIVAPSFYNTSSSKKLPPILDIAEGGLRSKDLMTLLRETRSLHATDPRDKVYAMLTLAYNVSHSSPDLEVEEAFVMHQMYAYQLLDWLQFLVELNLMSSDDLLPVNVMVENVRKVLKLEERRRQRVKTESQKAIRYDIIPDYSASIYLIYSELARRTITSSETLDIFDEVVYSAVTDLPSWVPDWSKENRRITLSDEAEQEFSTNGKFNFEPSNDDIVPLELLARGKLLGRVEYTKYSSFTSNPPRLESYYEVDPIRPERSLFFEISLPNFGESELPETENPELVDECVISRITKWLATIFSRAESLALLGMTLNVGIDESGGRNLHFADRSQSGSRAPTWAEALENQLRMFEDPTSFKTADGSRTYHAVNVIAIPRPEEFSNIRAWLVSLTTLYDTELQDLISYIDASKDLHAHLLRRLERDTAHLDRGKLRQLYPQDSIWIQKRDSANEPEQDHSMYAVVDENLFSFKGGMLLSDSYDDDDDYGETFPESRDPGRHHPSHHKSVSDLVPPLKSRLVFLKEVLHTTVSWMNEVRGLPERLQGFDPKISANRVFFTGGSHRGVGPSAMECGDVVCVLLGGRVPYILRPTGGQPEKSDPLSVPTEVKYRFVGECYVEGVMNGEAVMHITAPDLEFEWFTLA